MLIAVGLSKLNMKEVELRTVSTLEVVLQVAVKFFCFAELLFPVPWGPYFLRCSRKHQRENVAQGV